MATLAEQLKQRLERIQQAGRIAAGQALESVADRALEAIEEDWPSTSREVHVYATNRSSRSWRREKQGELSQLLLCPVEYSGYTNEGYTTKGPETARSYRSRGSEPYMQRAAQRALITWPEVFSAKLKENL